MVYHTIPSFNQLDSHLETSTSYEDTHRESGMTHSDRLSEDSARATKMPRIPINLREHKVSIAITWSLLLFTGCIFPIAIYFALHYGTDVELTYIQTAMGVPLGVISLFSLSTRTWSLVKRNSTTRPLGVTNRWSLDYFNWNFLTAFLWITVLIAIGTAENFLRIMSLPVPLLVLVVSLQLVIAEVAISFHLPAPFRFSSIPKGDQVRPGTYIIAEDICAVEGKGGQNFRQAWSDRYEASSMFRSHMRRMDWLWGTTGVVLSLAVIIVAFTISNNEIGMALCYGVPWLWAGLMALMTIQLTKSMLRKEKAAYPGLNDDVPLSG